MDTNMHVVSEFCKLPAPYAANKKTIAIVVVGNFATSGHLKINNRGAAGVCASHAQAYTEAAGVCANSGSPSIFYF